MAREMTNKLLELVDNDLIDKDYLIRALVGYLSEDDVVDMCAYNDIALNDEEDCDEDDGQPSTYQEYQDLPWGGDDDFCNHLDCDVDYA